MIAGKWIGCQGEEERAEVRGVFFRVDGADLETGEDTYLVLQATTVDEAEQVARKQGLLIAAVRPAVAADWGVATGVKIPVPAMPPPRPIAKTVIFEQPAARAAVPSSPARPTIPNGPTTNLRPASAPEKPSVGKSPEKSSPVEKRAAEKPPSRPFVAANWVIAEPPSNAESILQSLEKFTASSSAPAATDARPKAVEVLAARAAGAPPIAAPEPSAESTPRATFAAQVRVQTLADAAGLKPPPLKPAAPRIPVGAAPRITPPGVVSAVGRVVVPARPPPARQIPAPSRQAVPVASKETGRPVQAGQSAPVERNAGANSSNPQSAAPAAPSPSAPWVDLWQKVAPGSPVDADRPLQPARFTEQGGSGQVRSMNPQSAAPPTARPGARVEPEVVGASQVAIPVAPVEADRPPAAARSTEQGASGPPQSINLQSAAPPAAETAIPSQAGIAGSPVDADRALRSAGFTEQGTSGEAPSTPRRSAPAGTPLPPAPVAPEVAGALQEGIFAAPADADRPLEPARSTEQVGSGEGQSINLQSAAPSAAVPPVADALPTVPLAIAVTASEGIPPVIEEIPAVAAHHLPDSVHAIPPNPLFADSPISQDDGNWAVSQLTADAGDGVEAAPRQGSDSSCDAAAEPPPPIAAPITEADTTVAASAAAPMTARPEFFAEVPPAQYAESPSQGILDRQASSSTSSTPMSSAPSLAPESMHASAVESDVELEFAEEIAQPTAPARADVIPVTAKPVLIPKSPTPAVPRGGLQPGNAPRPGAGLRQGPGGAKAPVRSGIVPPRPAGFVPPSARQSGLGATPGQKHASVRRVTGAKGTPRFIQATPPRRIPPPSVPTPSGESVPPAPDPGESATTPVFAETPTLAVAEAPTPVVTEAPTPGVTETSTVPEVPAETAPETMAETSFGSSVESMAALVVQPAVEPSPPAVVDVAADAPSQPIPSDLFAESSLAVTQPVLPGVDMARPHVEQVLTPTADDQASLTLDETTGISLEDPPTPPASSSALSALLSEAELHALDPAIEPAAEVEIDSPDAVGPAEHITAETAPIETSTQELEAPLAEESESPAPSTSETSEPALEESVFLSDSPATVETSADETAMAADGVPIAVPAAIPIGRAAPRAASSTISSIILCFVAPVATIMTLGGLGVLLYSLFRSAPAEGREMEIVQFQLHALTQTVVGGVLLVTGMMMFIGAALAMLAGALKEVRKQTPG
jgi:hypothetical protein